MLEEMIPLNMLISYDGFKYQIQVFRLDRDAWIMVNGDTYDQAFNKLMNTIKKEPELFITVGSLEEDR